MRGNLDSPQFSIWLVVNASKQFEKEQTKKPSEPFRTYWNKLAFEKTVITYIFCLPIITELRKALLWPSLNARAVWIPFPPAAVFLGHRVTERSWGKWLKVLVPQFPLLKSEDKNNLGLTGLLRIHCNDMYHLLGHMLMGGVGCAQF